MASSFWQRAEQFPPILCRLLARHKKGAALSEFEIAERSGLSPWQINLLSFQTTWQNIDLPTMRRFVVGCGLDFCNWRVMNRARWYMREQARLGRLRKLTYRYLRKDTLWETVYCPLMIRYAESLLKK